MKQALWLLAVTSLGLSVNADDSAGAAADAGISPPASPAAVNQDDDGTRFGVGVMVGEPTGASLKYFFTDNFAVDGGIGWSFHHETDWQVHSDALWHVHDLFDTGSGQLSLYFGGGGRVKFRDHAEDRVGLRIPIGVSYKFNRAPVDVFVEAAPIIDFTPATDGAFSVAIGARYWF